jgi:hypothetical protein
LQCPSATRQPAPARDAGQVRPLQVRLVLVLRVRVLRVPASAAVQVFARMTSVRAVPSG